VTNVLCLEKDSKKIIESVVKAHGGKEAFYRMRDVQYRLTVHDLKNSTTEVSTERYLFDGELSTGAKNDRFTRKMNYFRFAMPFKLLDDGILYQWIGTRKIVNATYDVIDITFQKGVGDSQDRFRLFINERTKLIDQYLFTLSAQRKPGPF